MQPPTAPVCAHCGKTVAPDRERLCNHCGLPFSHGGSHKSERPVDLVAERREFVAAHLAQIEGTLDAGLTPHLYRSLLMPVDSTIDEDVLGRWDITELRVLGLDGWQVVGVIPRTQGTRLTNYSIGSTFGKTWAGGIGGSVTAAHILLQLDISPETFAARRAVVEDFLEEEAKRIIGR